MKTKSVKLYHQKKTLDLIEPDSEDPMNDKTSPICMNYKHFTHFKILESQSYSAEFLQRYEWYVLLHT